MGPLSALLTPELVKRGMRWFLGRNDGKPSKHIGEIAWALRCYAVKYRDPSTETATFFAEVLPKLRQQQTGLSEKNITAMAQFDDPLAVERFLLLPQRLWDLALAKTKTVEDGTLRQEATSARVQRYIKDWRCLLLPKSNPYLFSGRDGKAKDQAALRKQIEKTLWDHAALRLTPHQFRHAAAKILLDARPGFYEVVRKILGHKSMVTTYSHYAGAETQAAVELYGDIITDHRRTGVARGMPRTLNPTRKAPTSRAAGTDLFLEPLSLVGKPGRAKR